MGNKPIAKFSVGAVSAAVFRNETEKDGKTIAYHTVSLQKRYTDKDGKWKSATSFRIEDLPKAELCLSSAYKFAALKVAGAESDMDFPTGVVVETSAEESVPQTFDELEIGSEVEILQ